MALQGNVTYNDPTTGPVQINPGDNYNYGEVGLGPGTIPYSGTNANGQQVVVNAPPGASPFGAMGGTLDRGNGVIPGQVTMVPAAPGNPFGLAVGTPIPTPTSFANYLNGQVSQTNPPPPGDIFGNPQNPVFNGGTNQLPLYPQPQTQVAQQSAPVQPPPTPSLMQWNPQTPPIPTLGSPMSPSFGGNSSVPAPLSFTQGRGPSGGMSPAMFGLPSSGATGGQSPQASNIGMSGGNPATAPNPGGGMVARPGAVPMYPTPAPGGLAGMAMQAAQPQTMALGGSSTGQAPGSLLQRAGVAPTSGALQAQTAQLDPGTQMQQTAVQAKTLSHQAANNNLQTATKQIQTAQGQLRNAPGLPPDFLQSVQKDIDQVPQLTQTQFQAADARLQTGLQIAAQNLMHANATVNDVLDKYMQRMNRTPYQERAEAVRNAQLDMQAQPHGLLNKLAAIPKIALAPNETVAENGMYQLFGRNNPQQLEAAKDREWNWLHGTGREQMGDTEKLATFVESVAKRQQDMYDKVAEAAHQNAVDKETYANDQYKQIYADYNFKLATYRTESLENRMNAQAAMNGASDLIRIAKEKDYQANQDRLTQQFNALHNGLDDLKKKAQIENLQNLVQHRNQPPDANLEAERQARTRELNNINDMLERSNPSLQPQLNL